MQKKNEEYLATRTFCHLDKPILLSKELDISLVNIPNVNYSMEYEFNYQNHKVSDDLGLKNLYMYKNINSEFQKIYLEIKKAFNNTKKKNYSIKDITMKIIGQSITSKKLKSMYEFEDFILSKNIVVVYKEEYYVKTTYEGRKVTLPDEKIKTQVVNMIPK